MKIIFLFCFGCMLLFSRVTSESSVTVFNAYPRRELAAVFTFGTKKHYDEFVSYGEFKRIALTSKNYDYIVEYIKPPKQDILRDFSTFGYLSGFEEDEIQDSLIVIVPSNGKIMDHSILFPTITDGVSRIYFFNAMQNLEEPSKGVYVYCLYDRENFDGSRSKSILQLGNDVPFGQGAETALLPGAAISIKVFPKAVHGVSKFLELSSMTNNTLTIELQKEAYDFIILIGTYNSDTEPPYLLSRYKSQQKSDNLKLLSLRLTSILIVIPYNVT